eukprot:jgi/Ulvmu1/9554/UM053_0043.1
MRISSILRGSLGSIHSTGQRLEYIRGRECGRSSLQLRSRAVKDRADATSGALAMNTADKHALVERLHCTPTKIVLFVTGGGSEAISDMLVVPGASATVLEARVPYATDATQELLGRPVASFCSQESAILLAKRGYQRAAQLAPPGMPILGMSCTAALRTVQDKRGDHRMHIACHTGTTTATYDITLEKNARSRAEEETVCSSAVLSVAAFHCGVSEDQIPVWPCFQNLTASDRVERGTVGDMDPVQALLDGKVRCVEYSGPPGDRQVVVDAPRSKALILPGSFNPLHDGHWTLLDAAEKAVGEDVRCMFELCVRNADKGAISVEEISNRLAQFQQQGLAVVLTDASLYTLKAKLFPGAQFVLGYDTAVRIVMPKYYRDSEACMAADFAALHAAGCGFIVGGRVDGSSGRFLGLEDIDMPDVLKHVGVRFRGIPESQFRLDVSSTELRNAKQSEM